jgi:uncharacterized protein (DUF2141 family)
MLSLFLLAPLAAATAQPAPSAEAPPAIRIDLVITGLRPSGGRVMVSLFDSEQAWREGRPFRVGAVPVGADRARLSFAPVPPGRYAVRAFQDLDGDGKLNSNAFGVPIEPIAFSNGAQPRFGPPGWQEAAFGATAREHRHEIRFGDGPPVERGLR